MFVKPADSAHAKEPFLADWKLFDFIIITDDSALRIIQFIKKKKKKLASLRSLTEAWIQLTT